MKSSELIQNADGSIYHLALHPEEVSPLVITVGDPERVEMITRHFDSVELKRNRREFVTHTGNFRGKRITVISTGIGTDNIDIVFNELHALRHIDDQYAHQFKFIRLGTSGAVRPDIPIDSILASSAAIGMDGLLHFYGEASNQPEVDELEATDERWKLLPRPYFSTGSEALLQHFSSLYQLQGITLTAPGFYAPQGRNVSTPARVRDFTKLLSQSSIGGKPITNIEMETAGIYGLAKLLGHEAISISAILANRNNGEFSDNPEAIVERMIEQALELMVNLD